MTRANVAAHVEDLANVLVAQILALVKKDVNGGTSIDATDFALFLSDIDGLHTNLARRGVRFRGRFRTFTEPPLARRFRGGWA